MHPAAEESPSVSSSSRLTLSLQDCHLRYRRAISLLLLKHSEENFIRQSSLNHADASHIKSEEKSVAEKFI